MACRASTGIPALAQPPALGAPDLERTRGSELGSAAALSPPLPAAAAGDAAARRFSQQLSGGAREPGKAGADATAAAIAAGESRSPAAGAGERTGTTAVAAGDVGTAPDLLDAAVLADRSRAFEVFRKSYRKNEVIEENKSLLKAKYSEAKALGQQVGCLYPIPL